MAAISRWRAAMPWNETSVGPSVTARMKPVSSIGKKPFGYEQRRDREDERHDLVFQHLVEGPLVGRQHGLEERLEHAQHDILLLAFMMRVQDARAQHRRERERHETGDHDRDRDR